jgi:hypothetical protein
MDAANRMEFIACWEAYNAMKSQPNYDPESDAAVNIRDNIKEFTNDLCYDDVAGDRATGTFSQFAFNTVCEFTSSRSFREFLALAILANDAKLVGEFLKVGHKINYITDKISERTRRSKIKNIDPNLTFYSAIEASRMPEVAKKNLLLMVLQLDRERLVEELEALKLVEKN